ncbi:hypothetical protein HPB50_026257 [Hyalomma asiaticum]|uniref:Uncharacterized protein n=1 Tax=Hyalomma asiaticum TaxID=266040 RepID=A0ACB7SJ87_HYAAI|nr:hypothetical protein HPB50_026257 [Hyalomma asiaticum]
MRLACLPSNESLDLEDVVLQLGDRYSGASAPVRRVVGSFSPLLRQSLLKPLDGPSGRPKAPALSKPSRLRFESPLAALGPVCWHCPSRAGRSTIPSGRSLILFSSGVVVGLRESRLEKEEAGDGAAAVPTQPPLPRPSQQPAPMLLTTPRA